MKAGPRGKSFPLHQLHQAAVRPCGAASPGPLTESPAQVFLGYPNHLSNEQMDFYERMYADDFKAIVPSVQHTHTETLTKKLIRVPPIDPEL